MPPETIEAKRLRLARKAKRQWDKQRHVRQSDVAKSLASLARLSKADRKAGR